MLKNTTMRCIAIGFALLTFSVHEQSVAAPILNNNNRVDILWVVDSSGSMESPQQQLALNFASFIEKFKAKGYDFQIAVVSTDAWVDHLKPKDPVHNTSRGLSRFSDDIRSEDGKYVIGNTGFKIITNDTPDLESVFAHNVQTGVVGNGDERGFQSMVAALENSTNQKDGFLRENSRLAVIMVSDEDDFSHTGELPLRDPSNPSTDPYGSKELHPVKLYHDYLKTKLGSKKFVFNAISIMDQSCNDQLNNDLFPRIIGQRYMEMADLSGGYKGSLCQNFSDVMDQVSARIIKTLLQ